MAHAELRALTEEAAVYAWPLYEMRRMRAATSPQRIAGTGAAPAGQRWCNVFTHARELLRADASRVVTPNNDTLYTTAWLDLGDGPLVIDVPDTAGRYYVLGLLDFHTNPFAHIGQRLTGTEARSFLLSGPDWQGGTPAGFAAPGAHVRSPTRWVWIIGRILVDGPQDLPAVHALQDGFALRPFDAGRAPKAFDPDCDPKAPPSAAHYAAQVNAALRENPPPAREIARFAAVGIGPDAAPDAAQLAALQAAIDAVQPRLRTPQARRTASHWQHKPLVAGAFGEDHLYRAQVALQYIGMLESREAVYPLAWHDAEGEPLSGRHAYALRFAPDALPPVDAFWSLTMYDSRDCMLVDNPIDRYAIGDRTPGLARDADGGLTIRIAHACPADAQANWLPAPREGFYLCLRAYLPRPELLEGRYVLPPVVRTPDPQGPTP